MRLPPGWRRIFRNPFRDTAEEEAIREEITFHLDSMTSRFHEEGAGPEEATRRARERFGDPALWAREAARVARARVRARGRRDGLLGLGSDLRAALRQVARRPLFTALVLVVMTVGVASGTTVWAVLDAVLFRPLPFPDANRVVTLFGTTPGGGTWPLSRHAYEAYRAGQRSFDEMAVYQETTLPLLEPHPEDIGALRVQSRFFEVVGTRPFLGRAFTPEEDEVGSPALLILTYEMWTGRFGADPGIIGREVRIRGGRAQVVGVMPRSFRWEAEQGWEGPPPEGVERLALVNAVFRGDDGGITGTGWLESIAKLRPGVSLDEAQVDLDRIGRGLIETYPVAYGDPDGWGPVTPRVEPVRWLLTHMVAEDVLLLGGAVLILLILIAVNGSGLLAGTVLDRRTEFAVRASLGAGRRRLVRQVLMETGVLWTLALALGLALSAAALPFVRGIAPPGTPLVRDFNLGPRVMLGAVSMAVGLWLLSGLVPALRGARVDLLSAAADASGRTTPRRGRVQRGLIAAQIALACGLLTGATVLVRGYASLRSVSLGLDPHDVALLFVQLPPDFQEPYGTMADVGGPWGENADRWFDSTSVLYRPGPRFSAFVSGVLERMRGVPGVEAATFVNQPPLWASRRWMETEIRLGDGEAGAEPPKIRVKWVAPGYFETLDIPVLRGRALDAGDVRESARVVVVNEPVVRRGLGGAPALGRTVSLEIPGYYRPMEYTIVGVVPPVLQYGPHRPEELVVYLPVAQLPEHWTDDRIPFTRRASFLARYRGDRAQVSRGLREAVWATEPEIPIRKEATLEELYADVTAQPRFFLVLLGSFAGVALLLSAVGVLASLGQHVRLRTRELGVRRALGADAGSLFRRTLGDGLRLGLIGTVLGVALAWVIARLLEARVVGVSGWSPLVQGIAAAVLVAAAVLASVPPALRAVRVDPMDALRSD